MKELTKYLSTGAIPAYNIHHNKIINDSTNSKKKTFWNFIFSFGKYNMFK